MERIVNLSQIWLILHLGPVTWMLNNQWIGFQEKPGLKGKSVREFVDFPSELLTGFYLVFQGVAFN